MNNNKTLKTEGVFAQSSNTQQFDLSVSACLGVTYDELEFILEHRHLNDEEFETLFERTFGRNPNI